MSERAMSKKRRVALRSLAVLGCLLLVAQFVPVDRTNPPVEAEPAWSSPRTRELARRACFDCHSHETKWPWYSYVAPASWLVAYDVHEGRSEFNVSAAKMGEADEAAEKLEEGEMPPAPYLLLHPEARLTPQEKAELARGLRATFGGGKQREGHEAEREG